MAMGSFSDRIKDLVTPILLGVAWWSIQTEIQDLKGEMKEIRKLAGRVDILETEAESHREDLQELEKYFFVKPDDIRVPGTPTRKKK